jgi:hypothetical protein
MFAPVSRHMEDEPVEVLAAHVTLIQAEAEMFVLLLYQRLPLTVAMATGGLALEGDWVLTAAFDRWLQGG